MEWSHYELSRKLYECKSGIRLCVSPLRNYFVNLLDFLSTHELFLKYCIRFVLICYINIL